ncbi:GNAT family N-acetyltransferase [Glutamicibacter arilaitensis]|uniref:GNAT family N-acetyltransferase n=1 Tax=Glutamicibacter arilaitensis TaxID=256701 RepID=UPI003F9BE585
MLLNDGKLSVQGRNYLVREARIEDLEQVIALMEQDEIRRAEHSGAAGGPEHYLEAFGEIDADPAHALIVLEGEGGKIVGTMQLTTLPSLARRAAKRMQIEAVRVASESRRSGLGTQMIRWAICDAEHKGHFTHPADKRCAASGRAPLLPEVGIHPVACGLQNAPCYTPVTS